MPDGYYQEFIANLKKRNTPVIAPTNGTPRLLSFLRSMRGGLPAQVPSAVPAMPKQAELPQIPSMPKQPKQKKLQPFI